MRPSLRGKLRQLSLAQQFLLASLVILGFGMIGIGMWIGQQIEDGVIHRTGATTALYVESFVSPNLQELQSEDSISGEHLEALSRLLQDTPLGRQIVAFKVWGTGGRIIYSTESSVVGRVYPMRDSLERAARGQVSSRISELTEDENAPEREHWHRLLETYAPVRLQGHDQIIAIAEFYQTVDDLEQEVADARRRSWLVVGAATAAMYTLIAIFVRRASDTIALQQRQNGELNERVRRAALRTTALNEHWLRRISAELHDGPIQDLTQALLALDWQSEVGENDRGAGLGENDDARNLESIRRSVHYALQELRGISGGLALPQLNDLTLTEVIRRVIRTHERRTGTSVNLSLIHLPQYASLPVKITVYRVIQEALTNAYRHADGAHQAVLVCGQGDHIEIKVSDRGPGFAAIASSDGTKHLGLVGMRERVESLGGYFKVDSQPGQGTRVTAHLSLEAVSQYE